MNLLPKVLQGFVGALLVLGILFGVINAVVRKIPDVSSKRPPLVTTICIVIFLGFLVNLSRPVILGTIPILPEMTLKFLPLLWIIGLWRMKRWGLIGYTISVVATQVFALVTHQWTVFNLLPFIFVIVGFGHYAQMG